MNKSFRLAALTVLAALLIVTGAVAQTSNQCQGGANLRFVGVGSSAQTNALAYAATSLLTTAHGGYGLISFKGTTITDKRPSTGAVTDTGLTTWVAWDPSTVSGNKCDAYVYYQTDSGIGVKFFFAYEKYTSTAGTNSGKKFTSVAGAYATLPAEPIALGKLIPGLTDNSTDANGVPANLWFALNTTPQQYIDGSNAAAPSYCGNVSTVTSTSQFWCYFNAGATDIRPEDALYAHTRALTSYNGIIPPATKGGTLTGEGYGTTSSAPGLACTPAITGKLGCPVQDAFSNGGSAPANFNVAAFVLGGTDPLAGGTAPSYTTLSIGAAPMMVIVGNEDTANFGNTYNDGTATNYTYNDINRQVLSQVFAGYSTCVGDLHSTGVSATGGAPIQVIHREPLSGTYNTFEWTAVRTQAGGPLLATATPNANADNSQEQFNDPNVFHSGSSCASGGTYNGLTVAANVPQGNCFDPMFLSYYGDPTPGTNIKVGKNCTGSSQTGAPGIPVRLRAIGTGEEVKAVLGTYNTITLGSGTATTAYSAGLASVYNPIGYTFWSFANLGPLCSGASGTSCTGTWKGHYLTVDAIDPLFATEGGEFDPTPNPSGPYNPPVCSVAVGGTANCPPVPFTHIKDGKYPLWSLLRIVSFANNAGKTGVPQGVYDMVANGEISAANNTLSDFVPFLTHVCPAGQIWSSGSCISGSTTNWNGDLNLFVFRSHYKQTGITVQGNGHSACSGVFTGILLQGGTNAHPTSTCLVDFGNDVGGSVITVQKDVDFIADFGTEEYGLRQ